MLTFISGYFHNTFQISSSLVIYFFGLFVLSGLAVIQSDSQFFLVLSFCSCFHWFSYTFCVVACNVRQYEMFFVLQKSERSSKTKNIPYRAKQLEELRKYIGCYVKFPAVLKSFFNKLALFLKY